MHNAARLCRCYGTPACKGDDILDRPHRRSQILGLPSEIVPVSTDLLQELASEAPVVSSKTTTQVFTGNSQSFDINDFLMRNDLDVGVAEP